MDVMILWVYVLIKEIIPLEMEWTIKVGLWDYMEVMEIIVLLVQDTMENQMTFSLLGMNLTK